MSAHNVECDFFDFPIYHFYISCFLLFSLPFSRFLDFIFHFQPPRTSQFSIISSPNPGAPSTPNTRALLRLTPRFRPMTPPTQDRAARTPAPTAVRSASLTTAATARRSSTNSSSPPNTPSPQSTWVSVLMFSRLPGPSPGAAGRYTGPGGI